MKAEVLTLLTGLVAQHNGVSIPFYLWTAFGVWAGCRLCYIVFTAMSDYIKKQQEQRA